MFCLALSCVSTQFSEQDSSLVQPLFAEFFPAHAVSAYLQKNAQFYVNHMAGKILFEELEIAIMGYHFYFKRCMIQSITLDRVNLKLLSQSQRMQLFADGFTFIITFDYEMYQKAYPYLYDIGVGKFYMGNARLENEFSFRWSKSCRSALNIETHRGDFYIQELSILLDSRLAVVWNPLLAMLTTQIREYINGHLASDFVAQLGDLINEQMDFLPQLSSADSGASTDVRFADIPSMTSSGLTLFFAGVQVVLNHTSGVYEGEYPRKTGTVSPHLPITNSDMQVFMTLYTLQSGVGAFKRNVRTFTSHTTNNTYAFLEFEPEKITRTGFKFHILLENEKNGTQYRIDYFTRLISDPFIYGNSFRVLFDWFQRYDCHDDYFEVIDFNNFMAAEYQKYAPSLGFQYMSDTASYYTFYTGTDSFSVQSNLK